MWPNYNTTPIETFEGGLNGMPLVNATETGYYLKKYCDGDVNISTNNATTTPHAWVIMRLGEFFLNYAEAMYQYYGNAETAGEFSLTANGAINTLRDRADVMMPHWSGSPANWLERYERERLSNWLSKTNASGIYADGNVEKNYIVSRLHISKSIQWRHFAQSQRRSQKLER